MAMNLSNRLSVRGKFAGMLLLTLMFLALIAAALQHAIRPVGEHWSHYLEQAAQRQELLLQLSSHLGYGGLIQHWNDYLLQGDERSGLGLQQDFSELERLLQAYAQVADLAADERTALATLTALVDDYRAKLAEVAPLRASGLPADRISQQLRVDGEPARLAFGVLDRASRSRTGAIGASISVPVVLASASSTSPVVPSYTRRKHSSL